MCFIDKLYDKYKRFSKFKVYIACACDRVYLICPRFFYVEIFIYNIATTIKFNIEHRKYR